MAANKTKKALVPKLRFKEFDDVWNSKKLGDIGTTNGGLTYSPDNVVENELNGTLVLRSSNIQEGMMSFHDNIYVNCVITEKDLVRENDILICVRNGSKKLIGKSLIIKKEHEGFAFGAFMAIYRCNYNPFVFHFFKSRKFFKQVHEHLGATINQITGKSLNSFKLHLPTLPEQQKIAAFLSAVDEKIQLLTRKKELLEQYKKGVMQQLLTGKLRFKIENKAGELVEPPKWEEKRLGDVGTTFNGLTGKTKENFGEGKPYIQYMQIFANSRIEISLCGLVQIDENENQQRVKYGDVFFTTSSETPNEIGTSSVLIDNIGEMYLNSFCFGFRPNNLSQLFPQYSRYLFRSTVFRRKIIKLAQGSTRYNISKVELMKTKVAIPYFEEQNKIASFLAAIDTQLESVSKQITQTQSFKKGLLQQMFV